MKLGFSWQGFEKYSNIDFLGIRPYNLLVINHVGKRYN